MQDEEFRDLFHRMEVRLERIEGRIDGMEKRLDTRIDGLEKRLDTRIDSVEKAVADVRTEFRTRFEGLENRLNTKAGNWVVTFWGSTLAILIGAAFALTKWW